MPLSCPKCSSLNPDDALYCHSDGLALRAYQAPTASNRLARPFVFPSGRSCQTYDELVAACQDSWNEAKDFLRSGAFHGYFSGMGRMDLARVAHDSAKHPDPDRGLDEFLSRLPAAFTTEAKLVVTPLEVDLGTLRPGQDHEFQVRLKNTGRGLLHGSIASENALWLQFGNTPGQKEKLFQTLDELVIPVHVHGKVLRAANKTLEAKLTIQSSGGTATVVVRARVPVTPFPNGPLGRAVSPRQVAEKAKLHAKEAIPYFENGALASWYRSNGWTYPVQGPTAAGLGAVQQFFEALGLTPPPKVEISQRAVALNGQVGEQLQQSLQVSTQEKRPVYANAVSDQPWLVVGKIKMSGRTADIPLIVRVPDEPGGSLQANLTVTSNGNQKFTVPVRLSVTPGRGGHRPAPVPSPLIPARAAAAVPAAALPYSIPPAPMARPMNGISPTATAQPLPGVIPVTEALDEPVPAPTNQGELPQWLPFIPVAFMALALLGTVVRDLDTKAPTVEEKPPPDLLADVPARPARELIRVNFHDYDQAVTLGVGGQKSDIMNEKDRKKAMWVPSMRFGLQTMGEAGDKRLTYHTSGLTGNVCVRIDRNDLLWGESPFKLESGEPYGEAYGRWRTREEDLGKDRNGRVRHGKKSVFVFDKYKIAVTQHVEVIVGQSGDLDTCLIQYQIDNEDDSDHEVGLRFLLDTFIGNNDGVPFLIPGQSELVNTKFEFKKASDIPDFLQARETEDLTKPGTVAQLGLKVDGLEHPDRVTLGAYPNVDLRNLDPRCDQEKTKWEVPVLSIQSAKVPDSAVAIYWNEKRLAAGKTRTVGFTYGLGQVAGGEGGGKLALTAGGSFTPEGEISVTAYVVNPKQGQTVTLKLPEGFDFIEGDKTQKVPSAGEASRTSPVTWKIKAPPRTGEFKLEAETSNQLNQSHTITIRPKRIFGS
jgi:hypothetical protein